MIRDPNVYDGLFERDNKKKSVSNKNICQCDMLALLQGFEHEERCPEKGKTLAKWQPKKWRY